MKYTFYNARKCPECGYYISKVVDAREGAGKFSKVANLWRRRRACKRCSSRWNTVELDEAELFAMLDRIAEQNKEIKEWRTENADLRKRLGRGKSGSPDS